MRVHVGIVVESDDALSAATAIAFAIKEELAGLHVHSIEATEWDDA